MNNIGTATKLSASPLVTPNLAGDGAAATSDGASFGTLLARQVMDNAPAAGAAHPAECAPEQVAPPNPTTLPGKAQNHKNPAAQNSAAELSGNMIALLQPLQKVAPQTAQNTRADKTATGQKIRDDKLATAPNMPVAVGANMIALPPSWQETGTPAGKNIRSAQAAASNKVSGDQNPATPTVRPELSVNMVALPQPLQDICTPVARPPKNATGAIKTTLAKPILSVLPNQSGAVGVVPNTLVSATAKADNAMPLVKAIDTSSLAATAANQTAPAQTLNPALPQTANLPGTLPAAPDNPPPPQTSIYSALGHSGWANEFSQKISWMASGQQNQIAELHLNPPDLGPLNVVLKISDNQATAAFTSPHSAVREAVENAMPKLREILADNGITLGNTTVGDQPQRDGNTAAFTGQQSSHQGWHWTGQPAAQPDSSASPVLPGRALHRHDGMVDTFA